MVNGRNRFAYWLLLVFWLMGNAFFWSWWLRPEHVLSRWMYVAFTTAFAYYATLLPGACLFFAGRMRRPRPRPAPAGLRVAMVTTCVPSCESLELIERQFRALISVVYPHDSWVLDDEGDPAVRELAERMGVQYFSRAGIAAYNQPSAPFKAKTKAGNVNAWLDKHGTAYDFFVQLDIDHRPRPYYLDRVLGFFRDPDVGWVQAPSLYGNLRTWVARGAAEQELIFQCPLQQGFYGHAQTPFIIGSHTSYRTEAIRRIGGFQPTRAEDHLDTLVLAANGYTGVFLPEAIALGEGPESFEIYLRQQFAWARSIMQILFGFTPKLLWRLRPHQVPVFLFTETWYLLWSLSLLTMFALPVVSLVIGSGPANVWFPEFVLRSWPMPLTTLLLWVWSRKWHLPADLQLSWRGVILNAARWPVVLWAFVNVVLRVHRPYMITPKGRGADVQPSGLRLRTQAPYLMAAWLSCCVICITLTQRAYANAAPPINGDSGVIGPSLLALWGALFMLAVYVVNVGATVVDLHQSGVGAWRLFRVTTIPLLLVAISFTLFAAASASVATATHNAANAWGLATKFVPSASALFVEMPAGSLVSPTQPPAAPLDLPAGRIALGGYDPAHRLSPTSLDVEHFYVRQDDSAGLRAALFAARNRRVPLVTIEPFPPMGDSRPVLDVVVMGERDGEILELANVVAASYPQLVYLRWSQEMDLSGLYPWAANDPSLFREAFRHVVMLFRQRGATNVRWVWSPAGVSGAQAYYPGEDVVDRIGLTILGDATWDHGYALQPQSFQQLLRPKYDLVEQFSKPIIIAELGVSGSAERQREWLAEVPGALTHYPLVRALVYFNAVNSPNAWATYRPDWRIARDVLGGLASEL